MVKLFYRDGSYENEFKGPLIESAIPGSIEGDACFVDGNAPMDLE